MDVYDAATKVLNSASLDSVKIGIAKRKGWKPSYATSADVLNVITDQDVFPYPRYFRGQYGSTCPVVFEREAGWRRQQPQCYDVEAPPHAYPDNYPSHCFEGACSYVHPCYPSLAAANPDPTQLDVLLNRACVMEYR